jgi:hypothetical protein
MTRVTVNATTCRAFSGDWTCISLNRYGREVGLGLGPNKGLRQTSLRNALKDATPPQLGGAYTDRAVYYRGQRVVAVDGCSTSVIQALEDAIWVHDLQKRWQPHDPLLVEIDLA